MTLPIILLCIIYALNIVGYFQTIYSVQLFGLGIEANPIGIFWLENNCAWLPKFVLVPLFLIAIGIIIKLDKRQMWSVYFLLIWYSAVVVHNFIMLSNCIIIT